MREITFDLSADSYLPQSGFGGFEGEHNATRITLILPARLQVAGAVFYMVFEIAKNSETVFSAPLSLSEGGISAVLPKQVMISPEVRVHAAAYRRDGEELLEIAKSARVILSVKDPIEGEVVEYSAEGGSLPGLVVEDSVLPESRNPVSSDAVFQELETIRESLPDTDRFSGGRQATYNITSSGWKRVMNIIRGTSGFVEFCLGCNYPYRRIQQVGFDFGGYVKYPDQQDGKEGDNRETKPVFIKRYQNEFGIADSYDSPQARVTKMRIAYPVNGTKYPNHENPALFLNNPINCYLDLYVEVDATRIHQGRALPEFNFNFAGFADSYRCEAITEETDATDTGMHGETLTFHEVEIDSMETAITTANLYDTLSSQNIVVEGDEFYIDEWLVSNSGDYVGQLVTIYNQTTDQVWRYIYLGEDDTGLFSERWMEFPTGGWLSRNNIRPAGGYGVVLASDGCLQIKAATKNDIDTATNAFKPITSTNVKYAVQKYIVKKITIIGDDILETGDFPGQIGVYYDELVDQNNFYLYNGTEWKTLNI